MLALSPTQSRRAFLTVAVLEAVSWAGLLSGMAVKYLGSGNEAGVHVFGPVHGAAFLAYLAVVALVRRPLGWSLPITAVAVVCSVPPFASLVFEVRADRTGRLGRDAGPAAPGGTVRSSVPA